MIFPIISTKELASLAINRLKTRPVDEDKFSFAMLCKGFSDYSVNDLLECLNSPSTNQISKGIHFFNENFVQLFGIGKDTEFLFTSKAQELALFAKEKLGNDLELFDEGYTTESKLEDGTLFVWCFEVMFIVDGKTYTVDRELFYEEFTFYHNQPVYVVGKMSDDIVKTISKA